MSTADTVVVPTSRRSSAEPSRHVAFLALALGAVIWFWRPLTAVIGMSLQRGEYEHYSHIVVIPFLSLFLGYLDRRAIFASVDRRPVAGALLMIVGIAASWLPGMRRLGEEAAWSLALLAMVTTAVGAFILCYGVEAFKKASFPLLLLLLMVPLPPLVLHAVVGFLQRASAEVTAAIFEMIGVSVFRQDFLFALPGINIMIAEECSGIRSSLALFIVSLMAGHLFLRSAWSKTTLAILVIPLAIVKNAVRIVVLSMLAIHVDPSFITGSTVHRYSGIPVFAMSFAILGVIIWLLQRSEARLGRWASTSRARSTA